MESVAVEEYQMLVEGFRQLSSKTLPRQIVLVDFSSNDAVFLLQTDVVAQLPNSMAAVRPNWWKAVQKWLCEIVIKSG